MINIERTLASLFLTCVSTSVPAKSANIETKDRHVRNEVEVKEESVNAVEANEIAAASKEPAKFIQDLVTPMVKSNGMPMTSL